MKSFAFCFKEFIKNLIRLFFAFLDDGNRCLICNKKTLLLPLCSECLKNKYSVPQAMRVLRCSNCGKELISTQNVCLKCREEPVITSCNFLLPLFSYRLWNKELLFRWKIQGERCLSNVFAKMYCQALNIWKCKVVVPVPPRKGKIQKNGWDQIDEICQFLEKKYGFTILRLLKRNSVKQQKKLDREERLKTIKSAYSLREEDCIKRELKKNGDKLPDQICLIDDVCTTGSTIEACCQILKRCGINDVRVITLFTVD